MLNPNRGPFGDPLTFIMLEIVRGRTWLVEHTLFEDVEDGIPADLSYIRESRCHIRERKATLNADGFFEQALVAEATVAIEANRMNLSLTREDTTRLQTGTYEIDVLGFDADGNDESLMDPEPVVVVNRPSLPDSLEIQTGDPIETLNTSLID